MRLRWALGQGPGLASPSMSLHKEPGRFLERPTQKPIQMKKSRHAHLSKNCHKITTKTVTYNFIYQNDNSTDPPRARTLVSFVGGCVKLTKRFTHNPSPDPKKVTGSLLSISSQGHRHTIRDSFTLPLGGARHEVMVILASEQPEVWFGSRVVAIFFYSTKTRPPRRDFSDETKDEKLNGRTKQCWFLC